jgi:uncharacterized protein
MSKETAVNDAGYRMTVARFFSVLLAGALFGLGLCVSTMVQPRVVLSFLRWQDFGLVLVMGGAVVVTFFAYRFVPRWRAQPLTQGGFERHGSHWSRDTLIGAALFGVGWGLCGVCPGPAIAGLGTGNWDLLWAVAGIFAGAWLHGRTARS